MFPSLTPPRYPPLRPRRHRQPPLLPQLLLKAAVRFVTNIVCLRSLTNRELVLTEPSPRQALPLCSKLTVPFLFLDLVRSNAYAPSPSLVLSCSIRSILSCTKAYTCRSFLLPHKEGSDPKTLIRTCSSPSKGPKELPTRIPAA